MAAVAEVLRGLFLTDGPVVGLMTVEAVHFCLDHVEIMLTNLRFITVAGLQAVLARRFDLSVRMVAVKTFQRSHYPFFRDILMAGYALSGVDHLRFFFAVAVAFKAGHAFHSHPVDHLVLMAF